MPPGVTVLGEDAQTTVIEGLYAGSLVHVDWTEGDPVVLADLTLTGGEAELDGDGDALYLWQAEVRLERVLLRANGDPAIPDRPWNLDSWVDVRTSTLELVDVVLDGNHGSHAGIRCEYGAITLDGVTFRDNYVYYSLLDLRDECTGSLVDVRALDNAGANCDGALFALGEAGAANVELAGNDAGPCRLWQGGELVHATVADNRTHGPFALLEATALGHSIVAFNAGSVELADGGEARFNDVFGNDPVDWLGDDPTGTDGNLAEDPRFVSVEAATRDLHLADDSPLLDAGGDALTWDTDIDGTARPIDGDGDGEALPDPGAYEQPSLGPGRSTTRAWGTTTTRRATTTTGAPARPRHGIRPPCRWWPRPPGSPGGAGNDSARSRPANPR